MKSPDYLIIPLLQGFYWFDDGMQNHLRACGWSEITRPQSMVIANIIMGVTRPSDIARNLGISRQAIHLTIGQMIEMGVVELKGDPESQRSKIVCLTKEGERRRRDARQAVEALMAELARRIGRRNVENLIKAFAVDWGPPVASAVKRRRDSTAAKAAAQDKTAD